MKILLLILLLIPFYGSAQNTPVMASDKLTPSFQGGLSIDKVLIIPNDTIAANSVFVQKPSLRKQGAFCYHLGEMYKHNGVKWVNMIPELNIMQNIPEYNDNSQAKSSGLQNGKIYRTGDALKIVH